MESSNALKIPESTSRTELQKHLRDNIEEKSHLSPCVLKLCNVEIKYRKSDGMVDATALCKAGGKLFGHWSENKSSKEFVNALSIVAGIQIVDLIKIGKNQLHEHTWVHPLVATNIAQWISCNFAARVSVWLEEWKCIKQENETEYIDALNNLKPNRNNKLELEIKHKLSIFENGKTEEKTPAGVIDIETSDEIIEVKHISKWKHAIGQVLSYNVYKNKKCRIHLFYQYDRELSNVDIIRNVCDKFKIKCSIEHSCER